MAFRILVGDARVTLRELPESSVHCVVTSPPYWGLRSYQGDAGMIGLEPTFDEHLTNLVAVFREVRRVLRPDGTLWLNYGDAYATSGTRQGGRGSLENPGQLIRYQATPPGFKSKDLMMMPARVALALQADGWYLRSEIIWHKPNPMPESVTDRPTSAHEKIYLLSKQPRYFYDAAAVRTALAGSTVDRFGCAGSPNGRTGQYEDGHRPRTVFSGNLSKNPDRQDADFAKRRRDTGPDFFPGTANLRNVWQVPTYSFKGAHFATFPPKLIEPCIKAGTSERGCCSECGAPWVRVASSVDTGVRNGGGGSRRAHEEGDTAYADGGTLSRVQTVKTTGWRPSCSCEAGKPVPAVVLDPFAGAGTVGLVADNLGRDSVLIEISAEYAEAAEKRIRLGNDRADPTAEPEPKWSTLEGWAE